MQSTRTTWNRTTSSLAGALALGVLVAQAPAADIHVPADAPDIQTAVAAAMPGDEIVLADGTWSGPGNRDVTIDKSLVIRSANGPDACTIDCGAAARAFHVTAADVTIMDLDLANGYTNGLGAAILVEAPGASIDGCSFRDGLALSVGGDGDVMPFSGNGGAIAFAIGAGGSVTGCSFTGNRADAGPGFIGIILGGTGGAVFVGSGATVSVSGCDFQDNAAVSAGVVGNGFGGAIATDLLNAAAATLSVSGCTFDGNWASIAGGALWLFGAHDVTVEESAFEGNAAQSGGAIGFQTDMDLTVRSSAFHSNTAGETIVFLFPGVQEQIGGGAIGGGGAAAPESDGCTLTLEDSTFTQNASLAGRGGALSVFGKCTAVVDRCEFRGNASALEGGAVVNQEAPALAALGPTFPSTMTMRNTLLACNSSDTLGGGVANLEGSTLSLANCTLGHNTASNGGGLANMSPGSTVVVVNSILWGSEALTGPSGAQILDGPGGADVTYSLVKRGWPGAGNITRSPRWVDADEQDCPDGNDYRLAHNSPAINAGDDGGAAGPVDLDGNPRIVGDAVDMGAYEFQGP